MFITTQSIEYNLPITNIKHSGVNKGDRPSDLIDIWLEAISHIKL